MSKKRKRIEPVELVEKYPVLKGLFDLFPDRVLVEKDVTEDGIVYYLELWSKADRLYSACVNEWTLEDGYVYFGAGVSSSRMLPFETWTRGRDLVDGALSQEVVDKFIRDVIQDTFAVVPKEEAEKPSKVDKTLD